MSRLLWALAFLSLTTFAGCGGGGAEGGVAVYETSGTITLFGNPLEGASVAFAPTAKGQPTAVGKTDADGKYVVSTYDYGDGAAEGSFKVVVTKPTPMQVQTDSSSDGDHEAAEGDASAAHAADRKSGDAAANMVPEIYTSSKSTTLTAEVTKDGENVFDFAIE